MPDSLPGLDALADLAWLGGLAGQTPGARPLNCRGAVVKSMWQHSRRCLQTWTASLMELSAAVDAAPGDLSDRVEQEFVPLANEFFVVELSVRVWSALLAGNDDDRDADVRIVLANNFRRWTQVRTQILSLMLSAPSSCHSALTVVDQLRRRCERWSDLLICEMGATPWSIPLLFDPERADDTPLDTDDDDEESSPRQSLALAGRAVFLNKLPRQAISTLELLELSAALLASLPGNCPQNLQKLYDRIERAVDHPEFVAYRGAVLERVTSGVADEGAVSFPLRHPIDIGRIQGFDVN
jgi:hypothetical protein